MLEQLPPVGGENRVRGEVGIMLDGAPFVMRPTYDACLAIETQTGLSLLALAQRATGEQGLSLDQMATIVTECVRAHGRATGDGTAANLAKRRVGELLFDSGPAVAQVRVLAVLIAAISGGAKPKAAGAGEAPAAGTAATAPTTAA